MPNAHAHRVVARELLAVQPVPVMLAELPGPGQVLVGDAFIGKVVVGLPAGQDVPDRFEQPMGRRSTNGQTHHLHREPGP